MASIKKIIGVDGRISYKITVSHDRDAQYGQLRHNKTFPLSSRNRIHQ